MGAAAGSFPTVFKAEVLKGRRGAPRKVALIAPLPFCVLGVLAAITLIFSLMARSSRQAAKN